MSTVLGVVAPIFALILLGAAARHWRALDAGGLKGLTDLVFFLLLPALLAGSVIEAPSLSVLGAATLFFGAVLLVFFAGLLIARFVLRLKLAQATVVGMNGCYGNTAMLGIPLVSAAFGAEGVAVMLPILALHSVLLLPLATFFIELDGRGTANPVRIMRAVLPSLVRNPIIMALAAALAWRGLGVPVPGPMHSFLALLGAAGPAVALFSLGASLPDFAAKGNVRETGLAVVLKLVVLPVLVLAGARWTGLAPLPTVVAVLTAAMPTGANAFFLARRTGVNVAASAGTVVLATALSVVTLSGVLALLHP